MTPDAWFASKKNADFDLGIFLTRKAAHLSASGPFQPRTHAGLELKQSLDNASTFRSGKSDAECIDGQCQRHQTWGD